MNRLGYPFIMTSDPVANQNGLLVASKWKLCVTDHATPEVDRERWLTVRVDELDLSVLGLHIPGTPDNNFEGGYGISGAKRKELLWERVIAYAVAHRDCRAVVLGDFNTGFRIDTEGEMFAKSHYMADLSGAGFVDSWRELHPDGRDYTWYSKRKDKATGKSADLNGFRLDYVFVSPPLVRSISDVVILHAPRMAGISDHASLVADIHVHGAHSHRLPAHHQSLKNATDKEPEASCLSETVSASNQGEYSTKFPHGSVRARFDLAVGSLPDMACGLNGKAFVQWFRPTYVTAEWAGGVLKEVQIWGPRLCQDGSLGKRVLDHQWKRSVDEGCVAYSELPSLVAQELQRYIAANGTVGPRQ
ncbi:endonuclease/exonuclease/phosphatase [Mycobacterium asiaticum]|uniref:Endonuclease/exonuclease/phosphatase n=1 Tax=Mycobacterium asiaticum TaxID=1790 RepID=A0A1A3KRZ5_MYCAS|nr:endonuclease/exonuclease/phosphatase [Mycobacterium asiaticum]